MAQSATKGTFLANLQAASNQLLLAKNALADLTNYYFKNGFNSVGSNPIQDADAAPSGLTQAKVTNTITLAQQLANFFGNVAVVTGDYESTIQAVRTI